MELTFASETWGDVAGEFDNLGRRNFEEAGIGQGKVGYGLDHEAMYGLFGIGMAHITTARYEGKLVGYILSMIMNRHLMYEAKVSQVMGMYLLPEYREGLAGLKLMEADENFMRERGVQRMDGGFTLSKDLLTLFARRGWKPVETVCMKWLED